MSLTPLGWAGAVFASWLLWLPLTFWFGRVFCRFVCPLGLLQSLVAFLAHPRTRVRRVCTRLPRSRIQRAANVAFLVAYFAAPLGYWLNPWGIFGRALFALFWPGIVLFAAILVSALFGRGRLWCNWVCPLGTLFDLVARLGWREDAVTARCKNCRRCFT